MNQNVKDYVIPLFVLGVALIGIFILIPFGFTGSANFDFELQGEDYGGMFAHLAIVAVIVERFMDVYNSVWRHPGRVALESMLRDETDKKKKLTIQAKIDGYRAHTRTLAMYGAFALGLVVALAGINTLGVLFDATELAPIQLKTFKAADVLVTAGLIAGGSKGINGMTSLIGAMLATAKSKQANP